ncbi:site-specific integrase [Coprobacillus sp. AF13-15]|nr:site-specific integrase [Coprobacillus sp. AF13-15]
MSNVKRKDGKNRNLRNGESQRKDGRYVYKYTDIYGKPQFIYSWKLVPTDKTPAGKRDDISLREKEAQIKKDLNDGIDTVGGKMTVCQLYEKKNSQRKNIKRATEKGRQYLMNALKNEMTVCQLYDKKNSQRKNIKRATEKGRQYLMNALKNDPLGMRAIDTVKQSDAKEWAIRMSEKGYAYKTIDNYKRSLKASFYMAIQDDCIRKNPFEFKLSDVLEDDTEQKVILTPEQEERLLAFMEKDKIYSKYYDEVVLLLETGLRISEFCGLTTHIDMQNRILNIDHQLLKDSEIGYYIETPKTKNGKRELPLTERAYQAIQRILKNRGKAQPLIVGGYSNFLFLNREGLPKVAGNYEGMVRGLIKKYNKYHTDKLPNITPHSFRHTYCTNMANRGMNPNTLQYLMGHANITMTLGYYAHGTFQSAKAELERLAC